MWILIYTEYLENCNRNPSAQTIVLMNTLNFRKLTDIATDVNKLVKRTQDLHNENQLDQKAYKR